MALVSPPPSYPSASLSRLIKINANACRYKSSGLAAINLRCRSSSSSRSFRIATSIGDGIKKKSKCSAGMEGVGGSRGLAGGDQAKELRLLPERAKVAVLVAFVMSLCNADRVVMSVAVVPLAAKYGWSSSFLGIVQSSFLWGYLFSSVAGGALADRYGGKRVMAWGVAVWSLATFLTPLAAEHSTAMLLAVRILFGLAEGVALPSMNTLLGELWPSQAMLPEPHLII